MDRYQIALKSNKIGKQKICKFPFQGTVSSTINCIKYCIREKAIFLANNISTDLLNSAIIEIGKEYKAVILVENNNIAQSFSISYSYKNIFPIEKPPIRGNVICYDCKNTGLSNPILVTILTK